MSEQLQAMFHLTDKPIISKKPSELKEHPLNQTLFGDLKQSDYKELKEDIAQRGIQDPLHITKDNIVVSGHQRRKIALDLNIKVPCIIRNDLKEEWQIEEQLISDNLLRRHLSDYQKVECGERLYRIEQQKAEERQKKLAGTRPNTKPDLSPKSDTGRTVEIVGNKIGLKRDKYHKARKVYHEAPEPIKKDWQSGILSTHKAYKKLQSEQKKQQRKKPTETPEKPKDTYDIILADPPWKYNFSKTTNREIEQHYPTMSLEELKKIELPTNGNALLYMWGTAPKLREALELMNAWGFEYKTHAIWDKEKIGMGYWFRGQHELLLVGVKGTFSPPNTDQRISSIIRVPRNGHSEKPKEIYSYIEKWYPNHKKIELFARNKRDGWRPWGNEC